jgi:large subunit ribosomal protein L3
MAAIIGRKLGMTQVFTEDGSRVPVTVIEATPNKVTAVRDAERDGYAALQLAAIEVDEAKLTKAQLGHLKKADAPPLRTLVEFREEGLEGQIGEELTVAQFEPGQHVKVSGVSVGKGFQGTIRRHGFSRGPMTHGSHNVRAPGSIGASADPARVFKGQRMPGQMGNQTATVRNIEVVAVDAEKNELWVRGGVPGGKGAVVEIRKAGE